MKVIVGLGNPGREYAATRHNVGWWVVDHLADVWHLDGFGRGTDALVTTGLVGPTKVRLVKPQTYMNLSGDALRMLARRPFWSATHDLLVVVDDVALPVGTYRLRSRGSSGGHNGLKSIERTLATQEYGRLRIGIAPAGEQSREQQSEQPREQHAVGDLAAFVLAPFAPGERDEITSLMPRFTDAVERWLRDGIEAAMNTHNR